MSTKAQVLIVDDEPLIRMSAMDAAEEAGFGTLAASSYDQALKLLEDREDIAMMFTDVRMPGDRDGLELAQMVRQRWPQIGVIVTSGHIPSIDEDERLIFLSKPYSPDELTQALHRLA